MLFFPIKVHVSYFTAESKWTAFMCLIVGTLCAPLLLQFYANRFETLQVFLSWYIV